MRLFVTQRPLALAALRYSRRRPSSTPDSGTYPRKTATYVPPGQPVAVQCLPFLDPRLIGHAIIERACRAAAVSSFEGLYRQTIVCDRMLILQCLHLPCTYESRRRT